MTIQEEIINHKEGALLVMASAGSGKTSVLTERIKNLLKIDSGKFHVLALTFTNKAAEELKERLKDTKEIESRSYIGTFHSFCLDIIQSHGYAIGLKEQPHIFEKNEDRVNLLIQVFEKSENYDLRRSYENKSTKDQQTFLSNALTYISKKKKHLKGVEKFDFLDGDIEKELIQKMYREYNDLLLSQNAMDFDDVLIKAYQIFSERESIAKNYRKQYKFIFIDEAQDLNFAQYELLKVICNSENTNVMMVGDVKQSLYHFNSSDIIYMKEKFVADFNPSIKDLKMNYRSSKKIIEVANTVIQDSMSGYDSEYSGKFSLFDDCKDENEEAEKVVNEVENYLHNKVYSENKNSEPLTYKDIAILARNRYLLSHIENKLKERNIPYFFKKTSQNLSFDSQLMKIFDLGLRVLINQTDFLHLSEILDIYSIQLEDIIQPNKRGIDKLKSISLKLNHLDKANFDILIQCWEILGSQTRFDLRKALMPIKDKFFPKENLLLASEPSFSYSAEKVVNDELKAIHFDLIELEKYYSLYAQRTPSELKSLVHFKTQLSIGTIIPKEDENGIVLSTIHLSKGLEFSIVFVIGLDDGSLPYYKSKREGGKALEEEKKIFYVAVTRAKRALYLSYPKTRIMPWNLNEPKKMIPSEYINDLKKLEN